LITLEEARDAVYLEFEGGRNSPDLATVFSYDDAEDLHLGGHIPGGPP